MRSGDTTTSPGPGNGPDRAPFEFRIHFDSRFSLEPLALVFDFIRPLQHLLQL